MIVKIKRRLFRWLFKTGNISYAYLCPLCGQIRVSSNHEWLKERIHKMEIWHPWDCAYIDPFDICLGEEP